MSRLPSALVPFLSVLWIAATPAAGWAATKDVVAPPKPGVRAKAGARHKKGKPEDRVVPSDLLTWPRMKADEFGCMMEKRLKHRDEVFHCALQKYRPVGDPCIDIVAYYDGPKVPDSVAQSLHPFIQSIDLFWEKGELQMITVIFKKVVPEEEARQIFQIPQFGPNPRPNIISASMQTCAEPGNCLILQGFQHIGSEKADCRK